MLQPETTPMNVFRVDMTTDELAVLTRRVERMLRARGHTREEVEDLIHDALVKALEQKKELRDPCAWLSWVASNRSKTLRRDQNTSARHREPVARARTDSVADPLAEASRHEEIELLREAVYRLPRDDQVILKLYRKGETFAEMARLLGYSPATARRRVLAVICHLQRDVLARP